MFQSLLGSFLLHYYKTFYLIYYFNLKLLSGGIFHPDNSDAEIAFRYSIERVNMHERSFELVPIIHEVSGQDSFKTERIGK